MEMINRNASQVQQILKYTYGLVPIVAGLDKSTNLLTNWEGYLAANIREMLPVAPGTFMIVVGIIEILAGILVLLRPVIGAYVVAAWLALIALTLIAGGHYYDVAVRDLVMATGSFCLAKLSKNP